MNDKTFNNEVVGHKNKESRAILVDINDNIIGYKARKDITTNDLYRISALWVMNSSGDILIAQRLFTKRNDPGKWTCAACGTLEDEDTYDTNIYKEAKEEIGLKGYQFEKKIKKGPDFEKKRYYFNQWYKVIVDEPIEYFTKEDDEVEAIRWISKEELKKEIIEKSQNHIYTVDEIEELCNM